MKRRLWLFNSASTGKYFRNVLNTIALPSGAANEYRYRTNGDGPSYVHDTAAAGRLETGLPVTIVFADRWHAGGYLYVPLRHGELIRTELDGERQHYSVELGEYASMPDDPVSAGEQLRDELTQYNPPNLRDEDPTKERDGSYAFVAEPPKVLAEYQQSKGDQAQRWDRIVAVLSQRYVFATERGGIPIFTRIAVSDGEDQVRLEPRGSSFGTARLIRGSQYQLDFTFRFPTYGSHGGQNPHLEVIATDNLRLLANPKLPLDSTGSRITVPFAFRRYADEQEGSIKLVAALETSKESDAKSLVLADLPIIFRAKTGARAIAGIAIAIALFAAGSLLIGLDPGNVLDAWRAQDISGELWLKSIVTAGGAVLQAFAAILAIRIFGQKFL